MNKDAKQKLSELLDECEFSNWVNKFNAEVKLLKFIDALEPDHPKVKLPREVGEEFDLGVALYPGVLQFAYHLYSLSATEFPSLVNWMCNAERLWAIIDAYRYGWEAEPEAKWYVQTPESWKADDGGGLNWLYKPSRGGVDVCSHTGESDEQFTRAELKYYHFDSGIFTLAPVEEEK